MNSGEATNTNLIVFDLTRSGLETMIYHTREEHPNHYTTDAFFRQRYNNENCIQLIKHVLYYPCITQLSFDALIIDAKIIPCIIDEIPVCDFLFMKAH